jgi:hypothetical protein
MSDGAIEDGIVGSGMIEEPAPERIVLAGEQAFERDSLGRFRAGPSSIQVTFQQLIQLAHAASTTPAQATLLGSVVYHGGNHALVEVTRRAAASSTS